MAITNEMNERRKTIITMLAVEDLSTKDFVERLGGGEEAMQKTISTLRKEGIVFQVRDGRNLKWTLDKPAAKEPESDKVSKEAVRQHVLRVMASGALMSLTEIGYGMPAGITANKTRAAMNELFTEGMVKREMIGGGKTNHAYALAKRHPLDEILAPYPKFPKEMLSAPREYLDHKNHPRPGIVNKPKVYVSGSSLEMAF